MNPVLIYCYDALCGWCYGFSPVIKKIATEYKDTLHAEVLSGGMILPQRPAPIGSMSQYISGAYKRVEELSGITFGQDYLWHIFNPEESDWYLDSLKPAVAMCVFKEQRPELQVEFASDLQYSHLFEGRDLSDNEAYRHLLDRYELSPESFYQKLADDAYAEKARYEFALVKQLQVNGFPSVMIQTEESKFYMVARGFTPYETVKQNIESVLHSITSSSS